MNITQCFRSFNCCCHTHDYFLIILRFIWSSERTKRSSFKRRPWKIWIAIRIALTFMTTPARRHCTAAVVMQNSAQYNANPIAVKFELSQVNISLFSFIMSRTPWGNFAFILTPH